jgi:hypothetical protein
MIFVFTSSLPLESLRTQFARFSDCPVSATRVEFSLDQVQIRREIRERFLKLAAETRASLHNSPATTVSSSTMKSNQILQIQNQKLITFRIKIR